MGTKAVHMRLDEGLLSEVDAYARSRLSNRTQIVQAALRGFLDDARGGVPDLSSTIEMLQPGAPPPPAEPKPDFAEIMAEEKAKKPVGRSVDDVIGEQRAMSPDELRKWKRSQANRGAKGVA